MNMKLILGIVSAVLTAAVTVVELVVEAADSE